MSSTKHNEGLINGGSCGTGTGTGTGPAPAPAPSAPLTGGKKRSSKPKARAVKKSSKPKPSSKSKRTSKPKVSSKKASSKKASSKKMSRTVNVDMGGGAKSKAKKAGKSTKRSSKPKVSSKPSSKAKSNSKKVPSKPTSKASGLLSRIITANEDNQLGGKKSSKDKKDKPKRKLNEAMQATLELNKEVLKRSGADRSLWFGLTPYINTFRLKAKEQIKDHKDHKAINKLILELIQKEIDTKGRQKVADEIAQRSEDAKKKRLAKKK